MKLETPLTDNAESTVVEQQPRSDYPGKLVSLKLDLIYRQLKSRKCIRPTIN